MKKKKNDIVLGSVVYSTKGRDAGFCFAVVGAKDNDMFLISDGFKHKLNAPKQKNKKHLNVTEFVLTAIADKIKTNKKVFDSELRSALRIYQQPQNENLDKE